MTRNVLIATRGIQFLAGSDPDEPIEITTVGTYRKIGEKHHFKYGETLGGEEETTKNHVIVTPSSVEVRKRGEVEVEMIFEEGRASETAYATQYGVLNMEIATTMLQVDIAEDAIDVKIEYSLSMNGRYIADCTMEMNFKSAD